MLRARKGPSARSARWAELADPPSRGSDGRAPRARMAGDLACARVGARWRYACLLVDLANRGMAGRPLGPCEGAGPVRSALAALRSPISDIGAFRTGRGGGFNNAAVGEALGASGVARSLSAKGRPHGSAVVESTDRILRKEPVHRRAWPDEGAPRRGPNACVWRYSNEGPHSAPGCMSPVEFREAGLSL